MPSGTTVHSLVQTHWHQVAAHYSHSIALPRSGSILVHTRAYRARSRLINSIREWTDRLISQYPCIITSLELKNYASAETVMNPHYNITLSMHRRVYYTNGLEAFRSCHSRYAVLARYCMHNSQLTGHLLAAMIRKWRSQPLRSPHSICKRQPYLSSPLQGIASSAIC